MIPAAAALALTFRHSTVAAVNTNPFRARPSTDMARGLKQAMGRVSAGLTDVSMTIEDIVAEGDRVAVRLTSRARQVGEFMGIPPSGREYEIGEIHLFRVVDGQIAEHWHEADFLGMMRQLGAKPGA